MAENKKSILDTKNSKLVLEGDKKVQEEVSGRMSSYFEDLREDRDERKKVYGKRKDFYSGNQQAYSNIYGIIKDTKQKKGHTNQVTNYAGKTAVKIAYGLANNPPKLTVWAQDQTDQIEVARSQAIQDYCDSVFDDKNNRFWKRAYRRACFNQTTYGDAAIRTFIDRDTDGKPYIRLVQQDDMANILVGWNGTDSESFDCVMTETYMTPESVKELYGIVVDPKHLTSDVSQDGRGSWETDTWGTKSQTNLTNSLPTGKNKKRTVKVQDYDSLDYYAIKIEGELVQLIIKDDVNFPRVLFWTIVKNIPNPPSPWSISDIDYLVDVQIELNDNDNRTSDYIRVGGVQRYVAYNMSDFDPESIKTSSGQVIFVNDPDGKSRFEALPTNVNNFPSDQYNQRKIMQMYDMGLPKVNYGASSADSGRAKAIDYQSSIDLTIFKRDAWELALQEIVEKIQIFGHFLNPELDFFNDVDGNFIVRNVEFDWTDILPVSTADKIVNIANKVNMLGLPLKEAYKELGYRNPESMMAQLKEELSDPSLMIYRSKAWQLSPGLTEAQQDSAEAQQLAMPSGMPGGMGAESQPTPQLNTEQAGPTKPMAAAGTTAYSSAQGLIAKARQNQTAQGG